MKIKKYFSCYPSSPEFLTRFCPPACWFLPGFAPLPPKGGLNIEIYYIKFLLLFKGGVPRRGEVVGYLLFDGNQPPLLQKEGKLSKFIILIFSSFLKESLPRLSGEYPEGGRWLVILSLRKTPSQFSRYYPISQGYNNVSLVLPSSVSPSIVR